MKERLFIGIAASERLVKHIDAWRRENKHVFPGAHWVSNKDLHMTVVPPWEEEDTQGVVKKLGGISFGTEHIIPLIRLAFGPHRRTRRLIWIEGTNSATLSMLRMLCEKLLWGKHTEYAPLPHVTLARFKPKDFKDFKKHELNERITWELRFTELTLFRSHRRAGGAHYEVVHVFQI